jgi:hypothetical protein
MANIVEYFIQSELALASYANLTVGTPSTVELKRDSVGMSSTQAARFAESWTVIAQCTDPASGLSVTVFAPTNDPNARYLAIRGKENRGQTTI